MDKQTVEKYIIEQKKFSIPEIQSKFSLTYKEVRDYFRELEDLNKIKLDDDINYTFCLKDNSKQKNPYKNKLPYIDVDDDVDNDEKDEDDFDFDSLFDEDEEKSDVKKVEDDFFNKASNDIYKKNIFDVKDADKFFDIKQSVDVIDKKVSNKCDIFDIVKEISLTDKLVIDGSNLYYKFGVLYPDCTAMKFLLYYDDGCYLSDCGLTLKYLSTQLNVKSKKVSCMIEDILSEFLLIRRDTQNGSELCCTITNKDNALVSFLKLYSSIERIINIKI